MFADRRAASTAASQFSAGLGETALELERIALGQHQRDQQSSLAGGARDLDRAVDVSERVVVALEVVLDPGDVIEGLEARGQLGVGEPVEDLDRFGVVLARRRRQALAGLPSASAAAASAISGRSPSARALASASVPISIVRSRSIV